MSSAKHRHYEKTLKSSGKCFIYGKLLRHTNKVSLRFLLRKHSLLGTRKVILSIITRNFFVIQNKLPMAIGTNRMCISRDDKRVNTMCFPRQHPTTARKLLPWLSLTGVIRVVLSVSYLLVSYFVRVNVLRHIFSVCHSFRSMCQSGRMKGFEGASKLKINTIFCDRLRRGYKLTFMSAISSHLAKERSPGIK